MFSGIPTGLRAARPWEHSRGLVQTVRGGPGTSLVSGPQNPDTDMPNNRYHRFAGSLIYGDRWAPYGRRNLKYYLIITKSLLLLSVSNSGVKVPHALTGAFVRARIGRHDELHCPMVVKNPGLFGHHILLHARYDKPSTTNDKGDHCTQYGGVCQNNTALSVEYSRE